MLRFVVLPADALPGLRAREDGLATRALAARADVPVASAPSRPVPSSAQATPRARWPWALAWLLLTAAGWALERRVRRSPVPPG
jgi:hypothetical protein